jgi:hypothetical protein
VGKDEDYPPAGVKCLRCGADLYELGPAEFRVGGTSGGWKLFFGEWAELGEDMISFELLGCTECRHVELRLPPE